MKKTLFVTIVALFLLPLVSSAQTFSRNLYVGLSGPDVAELQQKLRDLGFYTYPSVTGWYGPVTAQAVSRFQQAYAADILMPNGLTQPTGTFGPATRAKLLALAGVPASQGVPAAGAAAAASSDPGCPAGFSYSFLTGQPCARTAVSSSASSRVSQSTPTRSSGGGSRSSSRNEPMPGTSNPSSNSGSGSSGNSSGSQSGGNPGGNSSGNSSAPQQPARPGTIIPAGPGFSGPTPQPQAIGTGTGADAKAIARWDVVPYQTFDGNFNVGVVAFHMNDIDRVEFSANGGPWISVREMTRNPQTDVVEYWATLRAQDFPDGPIEVRAIAYPKRGIPRVLQGELTSVFIDSSGDPRIRQNAEYNLVLYANSNKTLYAPIRYVAKTGSDTTGDGSEQKPYATVGKAIQSIKKGRDDVSGATIYLKSGDYTIDTGFRPNHTDAASRMLTITAAPGGSRSNVRLIGGARPFWNAHVHLKGLTVWESPNVIAGGGGLNSVLWVEDSWVEGRGMDVGHITANQWGATFFTDTRLNNTQVALNGVVLARNVDITNAGEDAFKFVDVIINSTVRNITNEVEGYHPDVWQYFNFDPSVPTMKNLIVYGLDAQDVMAQGVGPTECYDCAFVGMYVNTTQKKTTSVLQNIQFIGSNRHVYIKDSCFIGPNNFRTEVEVPYAPYNVVIENTYMATVAGVPGGIHSGNIYRNPASSCLDAVGDYYTDLNLVTQKVTAPTFTPDERYHTGSVTVSLASDPGAEIRYSLNGTNPNVASALYTTPFVFTSNARIKARAYKDGVISSDIVEKYYTITSSQTTPPTTPTTPSTGTQTPPPTNTNTSTNTGNRYAPNPPSAQTDASSGLVVRYSQQLIFDGDDKLSFSNQALGTSYTIAFWIDAATENPGVVVGRSNAGSLSVWFLGNNIRHSIATGYVDIPHGGIAGRRNHIAVVREGAQVRVYKNGTILGSGSVAADTVFSTDQLGARGGSSFLNAALDDVRIYSRALSASEVQALYNQ